MSEKSLVGTSLLPGDEVLDLSSSDKAVIRLGGGLAQRLSSVSSTKCGRLRAGGSKGSKLWVEGRAKRYLPSPEDAIIGVVVDRHAESLDVDIGSPSHALLPFLSFEGATRRNRPNLQVGSVVYARVLSVHPDTNPEITCMNASGKSAGFGPLSDGFLFSVSTAHSRSLLARPPSPLLSSLGASCAFEMAVGLNGRVWVKAESAKATTLVANAIQQSEFLSPGAQQQLVKGLTQGM